MPGVNTPQQSLSEWKRQLKLDQARQRAKALRYKRPALASMGWHDVLREIEEIAEACDDIRWIEDSSDITHEALSGDEDEGAGYRMDFAQLSGDANRMLSAMYDVYGDEDDEGNNEFDDCTVALIGNCFECVGYDGIEMDYFSLCRYESELAQKESAKRLMRKTKADMIATIGQCFGTLLAFYDLRQRYDYAKAALATATEHNLDTLRTVRAIEDAYNAWCSADCRIYSDEYYRLDRAADDLPDEIWIA